MAAFCPDAVRTVTDEEVADIARGWKRGLWEKAEMERLRGLRIARVV